MKRFKALSCLSFVIGLLVFLTGCPSPAIEAENPKSKGMMYFAYFDTVSYIYSYAGDGQAVFEANCAEASGLLETYHNLFDIYHEYTDTVNLCTINKQAGGDWVQVDQKLIDFLLYAKDLYEKTGGEMNIMLGAVLRIWHDTREAFSSDPASAALPTAEALEEARTHTGMELLQIDAEGKRVRITDEKASLDVGALGKGYATEMAAQHLKDKGVTSYVLNIGGNIRIIGQKPLGDGWNTGIKNPLAPDTYAQYINIANTSCVTSGNYERYFMKDGVKYHHVIDKDTLLPSTHFASVTVIAEHSGLADALSTALFCMSYEEGLALLEGFADVQALWITADGTQQMTPGFATLLTEAPGAA